MSRIKAISFLLALMVLPSVSYAINWNLFSRLCPEEVPRFIPEIEDIPIPVGCEVVDCCPGCPGPGYIDWRIRVNPAVMRGAVIRFEGLDEKNLMSLKFEGEAKLGDKGEVILGTGDIVISGLPEQVNGQVPVAFLTPEPASADSMKKIAEMNQDALDKGDEPDGGAGIDIGQFMGEYVINNFHTRWYLVPCPGTVFRSDKIRLQNNTSSDSAVIMADYRNSAGCQDDTLHRAVTQRYLGNVLSNGSCRSTVSVFSDDNAMSYEPNVTTWTNNLGDTHNVALDEIITVPVSVWVDGAAALTTAQNDFANANMLYNDNNVGVQFDPTYVDVSGNAAALNTIGTFCPATNAAGLALQGSAWYTPNTLNIYYVNSAFTGVNCGFDRNMNFIGTTANPGSLPHEIGHAYALRPSASNGHTNGVAGFGNNNIMWGGGPGTRDHFSVGQSFRINTDTTSMLNANGDRAGPTETCLPNVTSTICPQLSIDSLPH